MNDYVLCVDSCCDLPDGLAKEFGLEVLPLSVSIGGKEYYHYLDEREISIKEFYRMLREHKLPRTSQINPEGFISAFESILKEGKDILSVSLSSELSGTFQSALIARKELAERYPGRKIIVIDSKCASMGIGLLLAYAAGMKSEGAPLEETAAWIEKNKLKVCHLFTVGDLNHLKRGGRLSSSKAFLGTLLNVKPLLHVNNDGKLVQTQSTRGRCRVLAKMVDRMEKTIVQPERQFIYISHGDCWEDAEKLKRMVSERLPVKDIIVNYIGPIIGSHSGPDTLALFYLGNDREVPY
ncbi:MAG: DegV family protein [Bacilli bacterium]